MNTRIGGLWRSCRESWRIIAVAICLWACDTPTSPASGEISLAGSIRDALQRPVADARIEIVSGRFAGRFTTSDVDGRFQFVDPPSVSEPVTLSVTKAGYPTTLTQASRNAPILVTIGGTAAFLPSGDITFRFVAAASCTAFPASARSRTYTSTVFPGTRVITIALDGADFFPELRTITASDLGATIEFLVQSAEAANRFGDDEPIYERLSATEHLSLFGRATAPYASAPTSIAARFDGAIAYCSRSTAPVGRGFAPGCAMPVVECRSDSHQLLISTNRD